ncbi:SNAP receptor [Tulasnella sp. 403]|nr:SNAP receptor [Tulasnella sp. 403]
MVRSTTIARASDALPLAASVDDEQTENELQEYKQQAKLIFRRINTNSEPRCSIESGAYTLHYLIVDNVVYLTIAERSYPRKLAFSYLDELSKEFAVTYGSKVENAKKPYAFVGFDTFMSKTARLYRDSRTATASNENNMDRLNNELQDVTRIMTKNMEELLWRGDSLDKMSHLSTSLRSESEKYRKAARNINFNAMLRQWAPQLGASLESFESQPPADEPNAYIPIRDQTFVDASLKGASLWTTLELLQQHAQKTLHPQVDVKYDSSNPVSSPVVLHIRPHLDLVFSPLTQRLTLINTRRLRIPGHPLLVKYRDKVVSSTTTTTGNGSGTVFRRFGVSQVFGPTYSGDMMRYPGIWFGFEEDGGIGPVAVSHGHSHGHGTEDRNQEVKRIVVTQRTSEDVNAPEKDALDEPLECPEMHGELKEVIVRLDRENGQSELTLVFHLPPSSNAAQTAPVEIRIGETTAQDLIAEIGSPLRVHYKEDDRMTIHKAATSADASSEAEDEDESYFYNYFQYGIDFLISGTSHVVKKAILHSNVIEVPARSSTKQHSPPIPSLSLPPLSETIASSSTLEPPTGKEPKRKKKSVVSASPEPLIELHEEVAAIGSDTATPGHESYSRFVSLFDKARTPVDETSGQIDTIKAALSPPPTPSSSSFPSTSVPKSVAIPVKPAAWSKSSPSTGPVTPRTPMSVRQLSQMALSTSPPTMVLDRLSDTSNPDKTSLVGSTSHLMAFDGLVLEVSELGDVLSVMIF